MCSHGIHATCPFMNNYTLCEAITDTITRQFKPIRAPNQPAYLYNWISKQPHLPTSLSKPKASSTVRKKHNAHHPPPFNLTIARRSNTHNRPRSRRSSPQTHPTNLHNHQPLATLRLQQQHYHFGQQPQTKPKLHTNPHALRVLLRPPHSCRRTLGALFTAMLRLRR